MGAITFLKRLLGEAPAQRYEITGAIKGDVDLDGKLDVEDKLHCQQNRTRISGFDGSNHHWFQYSDDDSDLIFALIRFGTNVYAIKPKGMFEFAEITDPVAPAVNEARMYVRDTGGKTELVVRFNTGVIQQIAIEP